MRRFAGMRREHGRGLSVAQIVLQVGVVCEQVQRIGIQHQRSIAFERLVQNLLRGDRGAQAAADGEHVQAMQSQCG